MHAYYLKLAVRSLRRNTLLTILMIATIAVGVASFMVTFAMYHATSRDPIPQKSSRLYHVQIDNQGKAAQAEPPRSMDYDDAAALLKAHKANLQAALYPVDGTLMPDNPSRLPFKVNAYALSVDAFKMFDMPFRYGSPWSRQQGTRGTALAVISDSLNNKLFKGENSVGRHIDVGGHTYRITGVMRDWNPQPRFYDLVNTASGFPKPTDVFIPFTYAISQQMRTSGSSRCAKSPGKGWDSWLHSDCVWLQYWVELDNPSARRQYALYLHNYAAEQQDTGRFDWPPDVRLYSLGQWLDHLHVVPREVKLSLLVAIGFLVVCIINTAGLLLAKFMGRRQEIAVRRALGAKRRQIYAQFLVEAAMVGCAGGALGLLLTAAGTSKARLVFSQTIARLVGVDVWLLTLTIVIAVLATILAGFYPAWRVSRVQPAWQLKSN